MQEHSGKAAACPRLPGVFKRVAGILPMAPAYPPIRLVLQRIFAEALSDGALDALSGKEIAIDVEDLGMRMGFTQDQGRMAVTSGGNADVEIRGPVAAFVWLAAKRADADTLFFHRHLLMKGDTELGLVVKNLLDATSMDAMPAPLYQMVNWIADRVPGQPPGAGVIPG